ncbi:hypothetical protein GCM10009753_77890 [Streptantibioticus ferralitis]
MRSVGMPQAGQSRPQAGQRPGLLDGQTPEAQELAGWLRHLTWHLTQRELEERFTYGRT